MPVNEQLASSLDLSLHECDQDADGLFSSFEVPVAIDEQPHCEQIGFLRVDLL